MAHLFGSSTTNPDLIQYIYCVKLPFNCGPNSSSRSALNLEHPSRNPRRTMSGRYHPYGRPSISRDPLDALSLISMTWVDIINKPQWVVVKVGISKDPATRLHKIFDVFEKLGMNKQMYLGDISPTDTPEECIRKAKSNDNIVFIQKVEDIGTAEGDVRNCLGHSLGEDFIKRFTSHRGRSLNSDGMTEWIVAEYGLVVHLQQKFRDGTLYTTHPPNIMKGLNELCKITTGQSLICTASGDAFFRRFLGHCLNYGFSNKYPTRPQNEIVVIRFEPTNFQHLFNLTR